jgi:dTDP-4-amino-4,6-dideoxygalactose transaminase
VIENGYLNVVTVAGRTGAELAAALKTAGIGAARTYPETMDVQPPVRKVGALVHGDLAVSKRFCESVINLPLFYGMRDDEREQSVRALVAAI